MARCGRGATRLWPARRRHPVRSPRARAGARRQRDRRDRRGWGASLACGPTARCRAWGNNAYGQLGDGTRIDHLTPAVVPGLTEVVAVEAGYAHSLALRSNGFPVLNMVWAWGFNSDGQIGDGTEVDRDRPTLVWGLSGVTAIAAGGGHSLAVRYDGRVWSWGANTYGGLGDGTRQRRLTVVEVVGPTGIGAVTGGVYFSAALRHDGTVWAWGDNFQGQLGDGTRVDRYTPVRSSWLTGVTQIAAGGEFMLAVHPVPAPRFTISVAPAAGTITAGTDIPITVTTAPVNGSTHTIGLSVNGLPAGVTATFSPPTVVAGGSATLVLSSTELADVGPAALTITAKATPPTTYPTTVTADFALTVTGPEDPGCAAANHTDLAIPDAGPPATGLIVIPGCDHPDLGGSTVEVHIIHPRRGDLVLDLIDPDGQAIRLKQSNPADTRPNMNARFQIQVDPDLAGRLDNSQWRLRIEDVATGAVGYLDSWSLYL